MLQATVKLCCGIAHDPLRRLPGPMAAQKDVRGLLRRAARRRPSRAPCCLPRLVGQDADAYPEVSGTVGSSVVASADALQSALGILQQQHSWRAERTREAGAAVSSAALPGLGRVFRAEAVLSAPLWRLQRELFDDIERMPEWYPALGHVQVLRHAGPDALLTHEVTARRVGDLVGRRDFVSVRCRHRAADAVYLLGTAAPAGDWPPSPPGCIRAESRLSCMVLQPLDGHRTCLTWLLCMDLKGWIPASVLQRVLPQSQAEFIGRLRQRLDAPAPP